jgi:hypothetical protein
VFGCWENVGKVKFDYCETLRVMFCFHLFATLLATGSVYLTVRLLKKMSLKVETFVLASSSFFFFVGYAVFGFNLMNFEALNPLLLLLFQI